MTARIATLADCPLLAEMNHQLIRDEGHRNTMTVSELRQRMHDWLATGKYNAVIFERDSVPLAYALYSADKEFGIYLRQFFVSRQHRRKGLGRMAMELLFREMLPDGSRVSVEVLYSNLSGRQFWSAVGFQNYSLKLERLLTKM